MPKISGATVVVNGGLVTDVRVVPIPMVRGVGRVTMTTAWRSKLDVSTVTVSGVPDDYNGNPGPQLGGSIQSDLSFEFKTWPAAGHLRVFGLPPGWGIDRVSVNGVDVTGKPIEFAAGKDLTGIAIALHGPGPPR